MILQIKEKTRTEQDYIRMVGDVEALRGRLKVSGGVVCLVIAVVPNGLGLVFYPLGMSLLSSKRTTLRGMVNKMYYLIVTKYKMMGWRG